MKIIRFSILFFLCLFSIGLFCSIDSVAKEKGIKRKKDKPMSSEGHFQEKYAVIVGISQYEKRDLNLGYADQDAEAFYEFLLTPEGGAFSKNNMRLLLNEKATASALRSALGTFLAGTAEDDYVIIYFSGHGDSTGRNPDDLYLLTHEADPNNLAGTCFPMDEVGRYIRKSIKARRVVMITDTCQSGGIQLMGTGGTKNSRVSQYLKKLSGSRKGLISITASGISQSSVESAKYGGGHGVFTYYLLKALTVAAGKADVNGDQVVDISEAYEYVREQVKQETAGRQVPDKSGDLTIGLPLAAVGAGLGSISEKPNIEVLFGMFKEEEGGKRVRVQAGDTLSSGDSYFFYLNAATDCYLYLFQVDAAGAVYRLFPNIRYHTPLNPVRAGKDIYLPNPSEAYYLDEVTGREKIYLFASKDELSQLERIESGYEQVFGSQVLNLMGPAGVKARKEKIKKNRLSWDSVLQELSSSNDFFHQITFWHQ